MNKYQDRDHNTNIIRPKSEQNNNNNNKELKMDKEKPSWFKTLPVGVVKMTVRDFEGHQDGSILRNNG